METVMKDTTEENKLHVFGFVEGDVTGLIISVNRSETIKYLLEQILQSAEIRTGNSNQYYIRFKGRPLRLDARIQDTPIKTFERIDIRKLRDLNA